MGNPHIDLLVTLAASCILFGVPILLIAVIRLHRMQLRALREYEYPATDEMLKRAKIARQNLLKAHINKRTLVNSAAEKILIEIDLRIRVLKQAGVRIYRLKATHYQALVEMRENYSPERGDLLNLVLAQDNLEKLSKIEEAVSDLLSVDEEARNLLLNER